MINPFEDPSRRTSPPLLPIDKPGLKSTRERREAHRPLKRIVHENKVLQTHDLSEYLRETGRNELCDGLFSCEPLKTEPALVQDLNKLKERVNHDPSVMAELNYIRGLIRAGSLFLNEFRQRPLNEVLAAFDPETRLKDPRWQRIKDALNNDQLGDKLEPAVRDIEDLYNRYLFQWQYADERFKAKLEKPLEILRELRNRLYLRRVHPGLAKKYNSTVKYDPTIPRKSVYA